MRRTESNQTAVADEQPRVGVLDRRQSLPDVTIIEKDATASVASVGKIPGEITEVPLTKKITIRELFAIAGVKSLDRCEIQRNGQEATLDDIVESGDTILAIAKIRGN
jgi:hypothetical protein